MVNYRIHQDNRKETGTHKFYARTVMVGTLDTKELSQHMSEHGAPYTAEGIYGVLEKFRNCMIEQLLNGNKVKIDGIGTFYLNVKSSGAESEEEFTCAENIKGIRIRMLPEGAKGEDVTSKSLLSKIKLQKTTGFVQA